MIWLLAHPRPSSPVSKLGRRKIEKELSRSRIIRPQVSLILHKSFNTLCFTYSKNHIRDLPHLLGHQLNISFNAYKTESVLLVFTFLERTVEDKTNKMSFLASMENPC